MSALCNIDYQVNNQNIKTALDDFVKVGIGGRRRVVKQNPRFNHFFSNSLLCKDLSGLFDSVDCGLSDSGN